MTQTKEPLIGTDLEDYFLLADIDKLFNDIDEEFSAIDPLSIDSRNIYDILNITFNGDDYDFS